MNCIYNTSGEKLQHNELESYEAFIPQEAYIRCPECGDLFKYSERKPSSRILVAASDYGDAPRPAAICMDCFAGFKVGGTD